MKGSSLLILFALPALQACATNPDRSPEPPAIKRQTLPPDQMAALVANLATADPAAQAKAAWDLSESRQVTEDAITALKKLLDSPEPKVEEAATWALSRFPRSTQTTLVVQPGDTPPALLKQSRPVYPPDAFRRKIEGVVLTSILVSASGEVAHVEIEKSVPLLDAAALECVRNWKFKPGTRAGRPVPVVASAPITFRIF